MPLTYVTISMRREILEKDVTAIQIKDVDRMMVMMKWTRLNTGSSTIPLERAGSLSLSLAT